MENFAKEAAEATKKVGDFFKRMAQEDMTRKDKIWLGVIIVVMLIIFYKLGEERRRRILNFIQAFVAGGAYGVILQEFFEQSFAQEKTPEEKAPSDEEE